MTIAEPHIVRWTRADYYQMADAGLFDGRRVEMIRGDIVEMSPQQSRHAVSVSLAEDVMRTLFGPGSYVRCQLPLALSEDSEPEPDVAVVTGDPRDYSDAHPSTAMLVVEVADASLAYDRTQKASLYAAASIPEYWIVNLVDQQVEVHRNPEPAPEADGLFHYAEVRTARPAESLSPIAAPEGSLPVADLLP